MLCRDVATSPWYLGYLRPLSLAYVRVVGPYQSSAFEAWQILFDWLASEKLTLSPGQFGYGLSHDDPAKVPADRCRYDACIELPKSWETVALGKLAIQRTQGGAHLCGGHQGSYKDIGTTFADMRHSLAAEHDLHLDRARPLVVTFLDDPRRIPEPSRRATLSVPVAWVRQKSAA